MINSSEFLIEKNLGSGEEIIITNRGLMAFSGPLTFSLVRNQVDSAMLSMLKVKGPGRYYYFLNHEVIYL